MHMQKKVVPVERKVPIALALVLLLLALPAIALIGAGGSPSTRAGDHLDIAIEGVDRLATSVSNNIYPGQKVLIDVRLVHDDKPFESDTPISKGNNNKFTVVLVIDNQLADESSNVTTLYKEVSSLPINYSIRDPLTGMSNPFHVVFEWWAPLKTPPGIGWPALAFKVNAAITVDDEDKSDNFRSGSTIKITEPDFQPAIHEQGEVKPGIRGPVHLVSVGQVTFFDFELWNEGPAVDVMGIEYISIPEGWGVPPFSNQEVFPNNFVPLSLAVQVSPDPVESQAEKVYEIIARPYSTFFKEGPYEIDPTYTYQFKVGKDPRCEINPEFPSVSIVPGIKTDIHFTLVNTGNIIDTYTLSAAFDERASKEWKVSFAPGIGQPTVSPGKTEKDSYSITVKVTVPIDTARNQNVNLYIQAASAKTPGLVTTSSACTVFAAIRYAAAIEDQFSPFEVEPGKDNTLYFNFTNKGNDRDPNQEVRAIGPKGWKIAIDQSPLRTGRLGQKSTTRMTMSFFVPETSVTSEIGTGRPSSITLSAFGGPHKVWLDSKIYYFTIPHRVKVGLTADMAVKNGFVGGQAEFIIHLQNLGNYGDSFNLSCDFPWATLEMEETTPIYANDTIDIRLVVKIPSDAAADTNPDTPNVFDGYKIRVWAYSQNETKKGETLTALDLTLKIAPYYSFELGLTPGERPLRFSTDHDEVRAVKIRITNTGNIANRVRLDFQDNPYSTWIFLQQVTLDVAYKSYRDAVLMVKPKAFTIAEPRDISLKLNGVSDNDRSDVPYSTSLDFNLTFFTLMFNIPEADLRMNNMTVETAGISVDLDKKYSFQVKVENSGVEPLDPNSMSRLYVVMYDAGFEVDRANISYLPMGSSKTVYFSWVANNPGMHKLTFELEGDLPISKRGEVVQEVNAQVKYPRPPPGSEEDKIDLMDFMPQIILMVIFGLGIFIFLYMFNKIFISAIDTGYDEDGTYRPWAVRERIKDENRLDAMPARPTLPSPAPMAASRQLPSATAPMPSAISMAAPVAAAPPQYAPVQVNPHRPVPTQYQPMAQPRPAAPVQATSVRPMPAQPQPVAQARPAAPAQPQFAARPPMQPAQPTAVPRPIPIQPQAPRPPMGAPPRPMTPPPTPAPPRPATPPAPPVPPVQKPPTQ
jgi:uncharacterized membrane protein